MGDFPGKVILHWYSGSMYILKNAVERGYYFSINHQMILTNNGRKIINQIPMSQILIESDAPFTNGLSAKYSLSFMKEIYLYLSKRIRISVPFSFYFLIWWNLKLKKSGPQLYQTAQNNVLIGR